MPLVRLGLLALSASFALNAQDRPASRLLSVADRTLFAEYLVLERDRVPVILAVRPDRVAAVVAALEANGASVIGRRDPIGYLYVQVPVDAVESLSALDGLLGLQLAAAPMRGRMDAPAEPIGAATAERKPIPRGTPPSPLLAADNPFTGEAATQALAFKTNHPTFDGRGVVTAFVEPVAPNLSTMHGALDIAGRPLPKFAAYDLGIPVSAADPVADARNVWQRTDAVVPDAQGRFSWHGRQYRLPAEALRPGASSAHWRICRRLPAWHQTRQVEYDVLWAVDRNRVWVLPASAGTDFSGAGSASLSDVVAWVSVGDPGDRQARDDHAFVFNVDRERHWLGFSGTGANHAGMVGSVMAGAGFLGSRADGIAPAAQLAIFHGASPQGAPSYTGLEQMLSMLADPAVDVAQASYVVSDTSRLGDPVSHALWADRLIREHGKPFVKGVGNHGAQLFEIGEFTMAEEVFAVGAYTPRDTWRANLGIATHAEHTLASFSGYGPARDGGLKPDFLALTHTLAEGGSGTWYWADAPGYQGYGVSGGTSASGPHGAGHVTLLVSAARQTGIPHDAARLRAAIATTAKFLEGVEARAQGHGLIQVSNAWEALQRARDWKPPSFAVAAPIVAAEVKAGGADGFVGRGLFELSGWHPGQRGQREVRVTRTGGAAPAFHYRLRWKGDTEVFTSGQQDIELPLGKTVSIPVDIAVGASGSYSAVLDIVDPDVDLVAGSVLLTVMVADPLSAEGGALRYERASPRPGNSIFYVDVPADLAAVTVKLTKDGGKSFWRAQDPTGRQVPFNPYGSEIHKFDPDNLVTREQHFTYVDPVPGVWQFWMQNAEPRSMEDLAAVADWSRPMPLDVQIQGWAADAGPALALPAASAPALVTFQGRADAPDTAIRAIGIGATRVAQATLRPGLNPVFFEVQVDPGTSKLEVQLAHAAPDAQVGLYVYKVPEGERRETSLNGRDHTALIYHDPSFRQNKRYSLEAPVPGRYRIALDPIRVPAHGLEVTFRDTVYHPVYGSLEVTEIAKQARDGSARTAKVDVRVRAIPADGRQLLAQVGLFSNADLADATAIATRAWVIEK